MAKLNVNTGIQVNSPLVSSAVHNIHTHEGGVAYTRDTKSELYTLAVNYFVGEDTFYESASAREKRFTELVAAVAIEDPKWIRGLLWWMRAKGNIRTASILGAIVAVHARLNDSASVAADKASDKGWNRKIVAAVCQRADEPGEFLAGWTARYGRVIPQPVKRGLSDACAKLFNEYGYLKYDSSGSAWRFGDVIEMIHAKPVADKFDQAALYNLAISDRHGNTNGIPESLSMITANKKLRSALPSNPQLLLDATLLQEAGFTWEDALSAAGSRLDKAAVWEAIIPNMGIFALTRNLRNFEQASIAASSRKYVIDQLTNPEVIARSRMFPFRFYAAYVNSVGLNYASALEEALNLSVSNVPVFAGNNLVLSDISGSMSSPMSNKSKISYAEAAAIFAGAVALRNPGTTEFYGYANRTFQMPISKGGSLLRLAKDFHNKNGQVGYGTETTLALRTHYDASRHNRVFIVTDMQAFYDGGRDVAGCVDNKTWLYGFSLGGYAPSMLRDSGSGRVHELSGLTDSAFQLPALLERGRDQAWPWEN